MHVSIRTQSFAPGFSFRFPSEMCPNCGTRESLVEVIQETRKTTSFFLIGGTELTINLPLAVCHSCLSTIRRRPLSLANKVVASLLFFATVLIFLFGSAVYSDADTSSLVHDHWLALSVALGLGVPWIWFRLRRPRPEQTSFYQPVRIKAITRHFYDGAINGITFAFTNKSYLRVFNEINALQMQYGFLKAVSA